MSRSIAIETDAGALSGWVMGAGAPVLLLHGGPGVSDYMRLLEAEVAGSEAIGFQQRGLWPSAVAGPFSVERHVADAVAVLAAVGVSGAIAVGHSWGGHLALQLALARPDLISAVVAIESLGITGDGGRTALHDGLRARLTSAARARCDGLDRLIGEDPASADALALEQLKVLWPGYFAEPAHAPPPPRDLRLSVRGNEISTASAMHHLAVNTFARRLGGLRQPVVALAGQRSPMPVAISRGIAKAVTVGELMIAPGAGHLPWHEQPGCVRRALARARRLSLKAGEPSYG